MMISPLEKCFIGVVDAREKLWAPEHACIVPQGVVRSLGVEALGQICT
jgi:hypothetical protein